MPFKTWASGDLVDTDTFTGSVKYTTVEAFESADKVNKYDLNRLNRNIFESNQETFNYLETAYNFVGMKNGVLKDSLTSEFYFKGDSDVVKITLNPTGGGDTTISFARLRPGIAYVNKKIIVNRPQTHIAERQLNKIFSLDAGKNEGVQINYYFTTNRYQARITRRDINGTPQNYDYVGTGGTWGDSTKGYPTGVRLLAAIYGDTLKFRNEFKTALNGIGLHKITLEPTIKVLTTGGDSRCWKVSSSGVIYGDSIGNRGNELVLHVFKVSSSGDSVSAHTDSRTYIQHYTDFGTYNFMNVPQTWGDTDTLNITYPLTNTTAKYSDITNSDAYLTVLRKSGSANNNSVLAWRETAVPGISKTRTERFFMNKDLIIKGDTLTFAGDTMGKRWVDILEMSGDSWRFWGHKTFDQGRYQFLKGTGGDSAFKVDVTSGGVDINTSTKVDINATTDMYLTAGDTLYANVRYFKLNSTDDLDIVAGDSISLYTPLGKISIASTNSDVYIAAGDTLKLSAGALIKLNATNDMNITVGDSFALYSSNYASFGSGDIVNIRAADSILLEGVNYFKANSNGDVYITAGDSLKAWGTNFVGINSASGDIYINAGDSIKLTSAAITQINAGNNLDINVTGSTTLDSTDNVFITGDTFSANVLGRVLIDADKGSYFNVTGDSVRIKTTTTGDIVITSADRLRLGGDTILLETNLNTKGYYIRFGDSSPYEIGDTATCSTFAGVASTKGIYVRGSFAAYKIYNAVWNDYAEAFDYDLTGDKPTPGFVYKQTDLGLIKTNGYADKATIGVYSDSAGMVMGSKDCITEVGGPGTKIPIALAGKVKVWVNKKVKIGDLLVSGYDGYAKKANLFVRMFMSDRIIGKAIENSKGDVLVQRIWMLVK